MKKVYPVIFTKTDSCYLVEVPDLDILTEGKDLDDAIFMARDAISLTIVSKEDMAESVPDPSFVTDIDTSKGTFSSEGETFVSMVDVDTDEYRRKIDTKPVRRNVSLPGWLNYEVNAAGINVSRVLQEALLEKLHLQR